MVIKNIKQVLTKQIFEVALESDTMNIDQRNKQYMIQVFKDP